MPIPEATQGFMRTCVLRDAAAPGGFAVMRLTGPRRPGLDLCDFPSSSDYLTPVHFVPWCPIGTPGHDGRCQSPVHLVRRDGRHARAVIAGWEVRNGPERLRGTRGGACCERLLVLEQQPRVDRRIARLRQRETCADPLMAEHIDLDRQPPVEKLLLPDPEVDVDQRVLLAVLAVPG